MTLSEKIVDYVISLNKKEIPEMVYLKAQEHFQDTVACIMAGAGKEAIRLAVDYCVETTGSNASSVIGYKDVKLNSGNAAMVNAMAAHICDYDDMSMELNGHSSTVLVPTVLAVGEEMQCSGTEILDAYITGIQINSVLGRLVANTKIDPGWNLTSLVGIFGATIAAGILYKLSREQLINAIGIASGEASGTKVNYGTMTKDLTVGRTAEKAIFSCKFAKKGFEAKTTALDGDNSILKIAASDIDFSEVDAILNDRFELISPEITIKPYPTCRGNHSGIDAILYIKQTYDFDCHNIQKIICNLGSFSYECDRYHYPKTPTEGKFSLAYCIALILIKGRIQISDMEGENITDPEICELMKKVEIILDKDTEYSQKCEMSVILKDGTTFKCEKKIRKGDPCIPVSKIEQKEKFKGCCERLSEKTDPEELYMFINNIRNIDNIADFISKINSYNQEEV